MVKRKERFTLSNSFWEAKCRQRGQGLDELSGYALQSLLKYSISNYSQGVCIHSLAFLQ